MSGGIINRRYLDFFSDLVAAPAAKEIFSAFLEKRAPDPNKIHGQKS